MVKDGWRLKNLVALQRHEARRPIEKTCESLEGTGGSSGILDRVEVVLKRVAEDSIRTLNRLDRIEESLTRDHTTHQPSRSEDNAVVAVTHPDGGHAFLNSWSVVTDSDGASAALLDDDDSPIIGADSEFTPLQRGERSSAQRQIRLDPPGSVTASADSQGQSFGILAGRVSVLLHARISSEELGDLLEEIARIHQRDWAFGGFVARRVVRMIWNSMLYSIKQLWRRKAV